LRRTLERAAHGNECWWVGARIPRVRLDSPERFAPETPRLTLCLHG
jgi:hypothetical protein